MKKIIAWLLVLALTAAISIGATLAYLTDTDEDVNVMTVGKVKIDQLEYERVDDETSGEDAKVQEFHDNKPLYPGVYNDDFKFTDTEGKVDWTQIGKDGYTSNIWNPEKINNELDKMVFVKNKGSYDAYVRTVFAFEAGNFETASEFLKMVHLNLNDTNFTWEWVEDPAEIPNEEGTTTKYFVAVATYIDILEPGALTEISLSQVALDKTATNADVEAFGETYQILVKTQAIQADGFTDAATALNEGFGEISTEPDGDIPWETDVATKGAAMFEALHYLNADGTTVITNQISSITFGLTDNYADQVEGAEATLLDVEQDVPVYAYYVPKGNNYDIYLLSDDDIYAPVNCYQLFYHEATKTAMSALTALNTENLNFSRTENMSRMLRNCTALTTLDTSGWDTSSVTTMDYMFYSCTGLKTIDASGLDTENVTTMNNMFRNCTKLVTADLSNWDVSSVTNMRSLFDTCRALTTLNISGWSGGNVESWAYAFYDCNNLTALDVSGWDTSSVTSFDQTFYNCNKLTELDVSNWDMSNVDFLYGTFYKCSGLTKLDTSNWDTGKVTNMAFTFRGCTNLAELDVSGWDVGNVTTFTQTFTDCPNLTRLETGNWDTSSAVTMDKMFYGDFKLEYVDVSNWDVSKVTLFNHMFASPNQNGADMALKSIDVSKWNPVSAVNMGSIFYGCGQLTELDMSGWNMPKLENLSHMCADCHSLQEVNLTGWNTPALITVDAMFNHCISMESIDVADLDTATVRELSQMFDACGSLKTIEGMDRWNTSNVGTFTEMFSGCNSLEVLDLSALDTTGARDNFPTLVSGNYSAFRTMFSSMTSLQKLIVSDKISYYGDGTVSEGNKLVLPSPAAKEGYTALWQNVETGELYKASEIPEKTAATYVAYYEPITNS